MVVVATASRVSAWVKASTPASGSCTRPASRAGASRSSVVSTGCPATAASTSSEQRRPSTEASRSSSRVSSGSGSRRRATTSRTVAGTGATSVSVTRRRASSTRKNGLPSERACHCAITSAVTGVPATSRDQRPGLLQREAAEVDAQGLPPGELLAQLRQGAGGLGPRATRQEHDEPLTRSGGRDQPAQHPQGGRVGPVEVLEHQQDRALLGARGDRARDRLPRQERLPLGGLARVSGIACQEVLDRCVHAVCRRAGRGLERLAPGPQGRGPVVLRAAPGRHQEAALRGEVGDLVDQAGLPDPGLTDEQGARRFAGIRTFERLPQVGLLAVAADGRPADGLVPRGSGPGGHGSCRRGPVRDGATGSGAAGATTVGRSHCCRAGSWTSTACSRSRSSCPGSSPSSSASRPRTCRSAASASAWRPDRVKRQGVQGPDTFLQRIPGRGLLGGGDDHRVVAEREQAEHAILLRVHAELSERRSLEGHLGLVGEVGVRLAGPEREQLLEPVDLRGDRRRGRATRPRGRC